jgi:alanyl-tRNA synthetase
MTADELRRGFLDFFAQRGHTIVPSASLIPNDPSLLLTSAGMVQFKPYMLGDEPAPWPRATSVQKCFRTTDIDIIGTTTRHLTFFEMLGNFSLGDYFKEQAIPYAWELMTEVFGFDPARLWITVFETDDEAERLWLDVVGIPPERVQRMGEDDNFWAMGPTGPCGPCSEIFFDRGPEWGADGGPRDGGAERFTEVWNLVFMQYNRLADGTLEDLPRQNIDTGAGLERLLAVMAGERSVFETDVLRRLVAAAESLTGRTYGADERVDVSLRILAEHGRAMTFLVSDGVVPSNEGRGYVLRRIIRRAVRHAYQLGVERAVTPALVEAAVATMAGAYPELTASRELVEQVLAREEERFRRTIARGLDLLDDLMARGDISGDDAFYLHDTLGFPVELTEEIATEHGRTVDRAAFTAHMEAQRTRGQSARSRGGGKTDPDVWREVLDESGRTTFTGYHEAVTEGARVTAIVVGGARVDEVPVDGTADDTPRGAGSDDTAEVVLDRTPFYAEAGGQVGDTGEIDGPTGRLEVLDTTYGLPGTLAVHQARLTSGRVAVGDVVTARIDDDRRRSIRRNHTATHLLHWALREVLGPHVKQAGSLVAPDRLRFDFSHHEAVPPATLRRIEELANREVLTAAAVETVETSKREAEEMGAVAFFGDKYGDQVRVLRAGLRSLEFCGGTHVANLAEIGPIRIVSEGSIGANLRRIEALTGEAALADVQQHEMLLEQAGELLGVRPAELPDRLERLLEQLRAQQKELAELRTARAAGQSHDIAARAVDGVVAERVDGHGPEDLKRLANAVRDALGSGVVILMGVDGDKVGFVVTATKDLVGRGVSAGAIAASAARLVQGGAAKNPEFVQGGGKNPAGIDEALEVARAAAVEAIRSGPAIGGGGAG